MKRENNIFFIGVAIGIVLATVFLLIYAPRYNTIKSGDTIIRQDRWSGDSWRYLEGRWQKMMSVDEDWEKIDRTLQEALKIPFIQVDTDSALNKLRDRYPEFKDLSDDVLMERIKLVYSKLVLVNMYLGDFLKTSDTEVNQGTGQ